MIEKKTYEQLVADLEETTCPLFGGSLAYIDIELNLAMLIKLLKIKMEKDQELVACYSKVIFLAKSIKDEAHVMIEKDGEIFSLLRTTKDPLEKDQIVNSVFTSSYAFIENMDTLDIFLVNLIESTKGTLKHDYRMIKETLRSVRKNLLHILAYEVKKLSKEDEKQEKLDIIEKLK